MISVVNYESLLEEYKRKKLELYETDVSLRRITGQEPFEDSNGAPSAASKYKRRSPINDRTSHYSGRKRALYTKGKYARGERERSVGEVTPDEEESPSKRPLLQSTIVAKHHHTSRKATIEEQNVKVKARNRRMFGALMGTLVKFKQDEKKRQPQESMRAEVEQKVEAATAEENERMEKEKQNLIEMQKAAKSAVRRCEKQLERAATHEVFEATYKQILASECCLTRATPPIFFKPASHTTSTKKYLEASRVIVKGVLTKQKEAFQADLDEIKESYQKDTFPYEEIQLIKEESESQDVPETESDSIVLIEQEDAEIEEEDESNNDISLRVSLEDQEFEPIYD